MRADPEPRLSATPDAAGPVPTAAISRMAADWVTRRDAGLTPAETEALQAWIAADPRHALAWQRVEGTWSALGRPMRTGAVDRVLQELAWRGRRRRRQRWRTAAASLTVVLALVGLWWSEPEQWLRFPEESEVPYTSAVTAPPQPLWTKVSPAAIVSTPTRRVLPDGSVAELNDSARITVEYTSAKRIVRLQRGEAHFKVARDAERPFVVQAGAVEVRAVGTAFSVQIGEREVEVLVTEGRVAVDQPLPDGLESTSALERVPTLVEAGNHVVVAVSEPTRQGPFVRGLPESELQEKLAWRGPRLEFSGSPLADTVALLNEHNRVRFVIDDPSIADVRVSGLFHAANVDGFIRLLEASFGVRAERRSETEIALRRMP